MIKPTKGQVTIPTDENFVEESLKIAKRWGADAVRDCDGTKLPERASEIAGKVYNTYFVIRGDSDWAKKNPDEWQHVLFMTKFKTARGKTLAVNVMEGLSREQLALDCSENSIKYWEVIDRTSGELLEKRQWDLNEEAGQVIIREAIPYHDYTVTFLAFILWDPVHMYNYMTNGWNVEKHHMYDVICPKTHTYAREHMQEWCDQHPNTSVVRFTTFLYQFTLVFNEQNKERNVNWFGYMMSVSPTMLDRFEKEYGYRMRAEYLVNAGQYDTPHKNPSKQLLDYIDFVQRIVSENAKDLVSIVHRNGKEAMMFLGDCWIGAEPYGKYFPEIGLDAVVGSVGSGVTVRMLSEMPGIRYSEGRFLPYFFPDVFFEGNEQNAVAELNRNWISARRAIMRKPIDRIGFGGYLKLACRFPKFVNRVEKICDEFRQIYAMVKRNSPQSVLRVSVLNSWGKLRSWMCNMTAHELWYQQSYSYQGLYEALSGLPVEVSFINFEDIKKGALQNTDVLINAGDAYTAWSGAEHWQDEIVLAKVREFVDAGGGFIGIGEPTAYAKNGKFFQLRDILGVDKELGFTLSEDKYNIEKVPGHFILEGIEGNPWYGEDKKSIYALEGTDVLDIDFSPLADRKVNVGEVKMAVNSYGKGRSFYMAGMPYSAQNTRILYRALLWCAHREEYAAKMFSTNIFTECHVYGKEYALINNSDSVQETLFYASDGKSRSLRLQPYEIRWIVD